MCVCLQACVRACVRACVCGKVLCHVVYVKKETPVQGTMNDSPRMHLCVLLTHISSSPLHALQALETHRDINTLLGTENITTTSLPRLNNGKSSCLPAKRIKVSATKPTVALRYLLIRSVATVTLKK